MTSKEDDTLPLPGFSQELSIDATVDEDFIPASQPQSSGNLKVPVTSLNKSTKESKCIVSESNIDDTLLVTDQSSMDSDKSADFIPETETKKLKINYAVENIPCKKKLTVFDPEDIFKIQLNPVKLDSHISKIPESPALDTQNFSILSDSPAKMPSSNPEIVKKHEESSTEIIVDDSAETVNLEATPVKIKYSETGNAVEKSEISCSLNSDAERYEETQIFDNSSVLLLDQPRMNSSVPEESEVGGMPAEKYLQPTLGNIEVNSPDKVNRFSLRCISPLAVAELSEKSDAAEGTVDMPKPNENSLPDKQVEVNSNSVEHSSASTTIRKIDFKLSVYETPKSKTKPDFVEHSSDNVSDKSKRYSTSSSGSVYSDKTGLPFALPKRVSAISDLTDSSEEDFGMIPKKARRALERVPWKNEYLLPLKMDDIMQVFIENDELLKRPAPASPRKIKRKSQENQLNDILENSSLEKTSALNLGSANLQAVKSSNFEVLEKKTSESSDTILLDEIIKAGGEIKKNLQSESGAKKKASENAPGENREKEKTTSEPVVRSQQAESACEMKQIEEQTRSKEESTSFSFREGLPVFARWSDKRYYSGVLSGNVKSDRWDVEFDDGTLKAVREDFLMPAEWLKLGALVFVLVDDRYESGQIVDVKERWEKVNYLVELDTEKKVVSAKISDLCLTDVMASIVREKYKPLIGTPRTIADIDFDNVLSGKRLREQRTPSRPPTAVQVENSGIKKKASSKPKKTNASSLESVKKTPPDKDSRRMGMLKSEDGHLIEDKIISADSQSGNEAGETPLRGTPKERKGKTKPRSLSYEAEETSKKKLSKSWMTLDGIPIPGPSGPSGVKFKRQKASAKTGEPEIPVVRGPKFSIAITKSSKKNLGRSKTVLPTEKSRRKRKLDESNEDNIQKKSLKKDHRIKTRIKKG